METGLLELRPSAGRVAARVVVNAAGPWAGLVGEMAGVDIPITPLRRQWFTTGPMPEIPTDFPFVIDFAQSLYFHREGQGLLVGMSNPHELPGFDQNVDSAWELVNVEAAAARLPLLEKASLVSRLAGLYEVLQTRIRFMEGRRWKVSTCAAAFLGTVLCTDRSPAF